MRDFAEDGEWEFACEMARVVAPDGTLYVAEEAPRVPEAIRKDPMFRSAVVRVLRQRPGEPALTALPMRRHPISNWRCVMRGTWPPETLTAVRIVRETVELEWDCEDLNAARWCEWLGAWISRAVSFNCDLPALRPADAARAEINAHREIENGQIASGLRPPRATEAGASVGTSPQDGGKSAER